MSEQTIGRCSICGGEVRGHTGAWWATIPPPPAKCSQCGAVEARGPVIPMVPQTDWRKHWSIHSQPGQECGCPPFHTGMCNNAACPRAVTRTTYSVSEKPEA